MSTPVLAGEREKTKEIDVIKLFAEGAALESCLVVLHGLELGRRFSLSNKEITLGRVGSSDVHMDNEAVSRQHCKVVPIRGGYRVIDLGSTNGTYINDKRIREHLLEDGDILKVGKYIFKYLSSGNIENAYHDEIYRMSSTDGLTQIHNKRYFSELLVREFGRARRYGRSLSVVLFDVDHFKQVNDRYGHLTGDGVLKQLAQVVRQRLRREDTLARVGGEEFAILLPEIDLSNAKRLGEKVRQIVAHSTFRHEELALRITVSVGIASLDASMSSGEELLQAADKQLYVAKAKGRNLVSG